MAKKRKPKQMQRKKHKPAVKIQTKAKPIPTIWGEHRMGHLQEYINKMRRSSPVDLEREQSEIIKKFEKDYGCVFLLYASCTERYMPDNVMNHCDFEIIYDLLKDKSGARVAVYLETNGGSGQAAKEIADFLHDRFDEVHFIISGQAKSAGTILALSGNEILMTGSGALGPIDAQVKLGRTMGSAHGYLKWVEEKRVEALASGRLNPFDAQMVAQIAPQELQDVSNAYHYAIKLVKEWLPKYKFKNWISTQGRGIEVTDEMRNSRAQEIAEALTNQDIWQSHGESIRLKDLERIKLLPIDLDNKPALADHIYRIQAINRLLFGSTSSFKIFATVDGRIQRNATQKGVQIEPMPIDPLREADIILNKIRCSDCGQEYHVYLKFKNDPNIDRLEQQKGHMPFPKDGKFKCPCGKIIDLTGFRSTMEQARGQKAFV